tara:strand:- start:103 stop:387 length:285 start_codon:yes stop_codon:yes gene_type:complete
LSVKKQVQQSRRTQFRDGFPISSTDINDIFDAYLYDLFTILDRDSTTAISNNQLRENFNLLVKTMNDLDSLLYNRKDRSVVETKDDHTPNWRTI